MRMNATILAFMVLLSAAGARASAPTTAARDSRREVVGVAAATQADVVVAWDGRTIWALDGSKTFLDGDESVRAVVVAADGTVYAIRGKNRLGIAKPEQEAEWHRTPIAGETRGLQLYDDRLAWIVDNKLALTQDQGESWTIQKLPPNAYHGRLRFWPRGTIDLLVFIENCHSGDYTVRYRGRVNSNRWQQTGTGPETDYDHPHFGSRFSRRTDLSQGGRTFIVDKTPSGGERLLQRTERNGQVVVLDERVPLGVELAAVDNLGRVLGLSGGRVWRWSARDRWQAFGRAPRIPATPDR